MKILQRKYSKKATLPFESFLLEESVNYLTFIAKLPKGINKSDTEY